MGTKPDAHQSTCAPALTANNSSVNMCTSSYSKQFRTKTWGEPRVKHTASNEGNENQVCKENKTKQMENKKWIDDG